MEDNDYRNETQDFGRDARTSSVEYGPYDYDEKYKQADKKRRNGFIALVLTVAVLLAAVCIASGIWLGKRMMDEGGADGNGAIEGSLLSGNVIIHVTDENAVIKDGSVASVVQKCDASVVEIMTESTGVGNERLDGAGSGVIIGVDEQKGYTYIVTNNHVVEGASTVTVRTNDGKEYKAEGVGTDWQSDIAVLCIEAKGLKTAVCARSSSLKKGQDVVVIGNPFGSLGGSVTSGVLSGLDRTITIEGIPMSLLQVDAAINPGNSGGGLFDMNGNLIGVVNAKSTGSVVDDIGFAIPIDEARSVFEEIIQNGYVAGRAELGFTFASDEDTGHGLTVKSYAYNEDLSVKINADDVLYSITAQNGKEVVLDDISDYRGVLSTLSVGNTVTAKMYRPTVSGWMVRYTEYTVTLTVRESIPVTGN